jgi:hypothetical protein
VQCIIRESSLTVTVRQQAESRCIYWSRLIFVDNKQIRILSRQVVLLDYRLFRVFSVLLLMSGRHRSGIIAEPLIVCRNYFSLRTVSEVTKRTPASLSRFIGEKVADVSFDIRILIFQSTAALNYKVPDSGCRMADESIVFGIRCVPH